MRERISSLGRKVGEKEREGNGLKIRMRERRHNRQIREFFKRTEMSPRVIDFFYENKFIKLNFYVLCNLFSIYL